MEIYDVDLPDEDRLVKPRRSLIFMGTFALCAIASLLLGWLRPDPRLASLWPRHVVAFEFGRGMFLIAGWSLYSLVMSVYFASKKFWLAAKKSLQSYQIIVEEDRIWTTNFKSFNSMHSKSIKRGMIKILTETEKGLLISSRDQFGTFFFGGIWIPKQLAEYDHVKRLMANWKVLKGA